MNLVALWNHDLVVVTVLLTLAMTLICLAAAMVRRSAALRNCILVPGVVLAIAAPLAPATARTFGLSIEIPIVHEAAEAPATITAPAADHRGLVASKVDRAAPDPAPPAAAAAPSGSTIAARPSARASVGQLLRDVALGAWATGTGIGLAGIVVALVRLRRLIAASTPVTSREFDPLGRPRVPKSGVPGP